MGPSTEDALQEVIADGPLGHSGCELELLSDSADHPGLQCEDAADELTVGAADGEETRGRRGALDPVRIRAVTRSELYR
jgi:hypothetical protein